MICVISVVGLCSLRSSRRVRVSEFLFAFGFFPFGPFLFAVVLEAGSVGKSLCQGPWEMLCALSCFILQVLWFLIAFVGDAMDGRELRKLVSLRMSCQCLRH